MHTYTSHLHGKPLIFLGMESNLHFFPLKTSVFKSLDFYMWVALAKSQKICRGSECFTQGFSFCFTVIAIICFGVRGIKYINIVGICPDCWAFSDIHTTLGALCHNSVNFLYCIFISGLTSKPPLHKFNTHNLEPFSVPAGNPNKCTCELHSRLVGEDG